MAHLEIIFFGKVKDHVSPLSSSIGGIKNLRRRKEHSEENPNLSFTVVTKSASRSGLSLLGRSQKVWFQKKLRPAHGTPRPALSLHLHLSEKDRKGWE